MTLPFAAVVTTIREPTSAIVRLSEAVGARGGELFVVGDAKGPEFYDLPAVQFFSADKQRTLPFKLAASLPFHHYSRKNLGYLLAIRAAAKSIYETDDDNTLLDRWEPRRPEANVRELPFREWRNVYHCFAENRIWPRGIPLIHMVGEKDDLSPDDVPLVSTRAPIQQGLVNGSPDVDAMWRIVMDRHVEFPQKPSLRLQPGCWSPFNSQNTWWWPECYPLLYLPSHCSFRVTDIWRGYVAQRCLWELGHGLVFHAPDVIQERNPHNLHQDYLDEVPLYLRAMEFAETLQSIELSPGPATVSRNLRRCYVSLVAADFFPEAELDLLELWIADVEQLESRRAHS